jgi:HSP20 family protein
MAIIRFDPFRDLAVLQERMKLYRGEWVPPVDIYETDGELVLKAELPDMKREHIDVSVEHSTLTIRGERKLDNDVKQENFHRVERAYGSFVRSFALPTTVDSSRIAAEYKNGVLTVKLPMREEAKARTIDVKVA